MIYFIDLFAGAGGTTTGLSQVKGIKVVACINHDSNAIKSHTENHPECLHFVEDPTAKAIELLKTKIRKLSNGSEQLAIQIIEQSIMNSWQDVFEIRQSFAKPKQDQKEQMQDALKDFALEKFNNLKNKYNGQ